MTTTATFTTTDEQQLLRDTVRDLLAEHATSERVREVMATPQGVDLELWERLAELGLCGLTIPEEHGGAGATFQELSIVFEELGRRLAPVPLLSSIALAATAVMEAGSSEQCTGLLPDVATGRIRLALAHLAGSGRATADPQVHARRDGDDIVLAGTAGYVVDGASADVLVTAALGDSGLELYLVPADASGLDRQPVEVLDQTRPLATVTYDDVRVSPDARLAGGDAMTALHRAIATGVVAIACEQVGGIQQVLATTTAYARERVQFGRAVGSFQAVKHRLAEMLVASESARSAAYHAARVLADDDREELRIAAPLAKSYCSEVYERAAGDSIQLHGGIGFTWEHDAHLYYKRAKSTKLLLGSPRHHRALLGDALGL